jgi:hypothetical protein
MFCAPGLVFGGTEGVGPVFMFCTLRRIFGGTEGVGSRLNVLRVRTCFRRYLRCRVPFSCFARSDSFSTVSCASGPVFMFCAPVLVLRGTEAWNRVFMFCAPGLVFDGTKGIRSRFYVLRARTHFRLYRVRRVLFSCFALPDSFSAVPRASGPVSMFCVPRLVFCGTEGDGSRFHVLFSRTHFRRYRGRRVPFSCFASPESYSAVLRVSGPVFMFCAPGLVFGDTEGVLSRFHVLRARTRFRRFRGRQIPISCFALLDSFSTVSGS